MSVIVQKFGGTSVQSKEMMNRLCEIVHNYKIKGYSQVIVVSAMGRKGDPYSTDTLIGLLSNSVNKREMDTLMSCGEIISGTLLTAMLQANGIDSIFLTGNQAGIITDKNYNDAKILNIITDRIKGELGCGKVVVVAGFQGATSDGETTTIGRGGSDVSAVALGKYLGCKSVNIYTDVDGIMTADPRIEPGAKLIKFIDYDICLKIAENGAKVIHPNAIEFAKNGSINLAIKNTLRPYSSGTTIGYFSEEINKHNIYEIEKDADRFTVITNKNDIAAINIFEKQDKLNNLYTKINDENIKIKSLKLSEHMCLIVENKDLEKFEKLVLNCNLEYEITNNYSKLAIISSEQKDITSVTNKLPSILFDNNIVAHQIFELDNCIICLIDRLDEVKAIKHIHKALNSIEEEALY